jgi:hypothetical protein
MATARRKREDTPAVGSPPDNPEPGTNRRPDDAGSAELETLRREIALLHSRVERLEREAAAMRALVAETKRLQLWDFTPYQLHPDESWVAVDRAAATRLLAALARIDHWEPWHSRIEPRPQP